MYKAVAVFCGSNIGNDPIYEQHAKEVGKLLSERRIILIYGGGNTGLMAAIANTMLEHNGKVIGIIPEILKQRERQHEKITELRIVLDMHARKKSCMTYVMQQSFCPVVMVHSMRCLKWLHGIH